MPTYEYACRDCGQHVEVVQSFRDDPLTECTSCGGRLRKVYGATGIIFKGSGYYVTDSRKSAKSAKAGGDKGEAAKTDKTAEPAAKKEPTSTESSSKSSETPAKSA